MLDKTKMMSLNDSVETTKSARQTRADFYFGVKT